MYNAKGIENGCGEVVKLPQNRGLKDKINKKGEYLCCTRSSWLRPAATK